MLILRKVRPCDWQYLKSSIYNSRAVSNDQLGHELIVVKSGEMS